MNLLDTALDLAAHGMSVVPVANDGTKRPHISWKHFQQYRPDERDINQWFGLADYDGMGVVCGAVSGNLEMLEAEGRAVALAGKLGTILAEHGHAELWERLKAGWMEVSPSGGLHWFYRVDGPARGNTKLARRKSDTGVEVLLETRGEGGFVVVAPSGGRAHRDSLTWQRIIGGPASVPVLTVEERDMLHALAALLDEMPAAQEAEYTFDGPRRTISDTERPGDDFNARATWGDILEPHGWQRGHKIGDGYAWTRPGKDRRDGISATTGQSTDGVDRLYVFSTSTPFESEKPYTKFGAHALLNFGGDHPAAARQLRREGYGSPGLALVVDPIDFARTGTWDVPPVIDGATVTPLPHVDTIFDQHVQEKLYELRVIDRARDLLATEKAGDAPPFDHGALGDILARPDDPPHRVAGLIPWGASTLVTAMRKTGKTTLTLSLTRSLLLGGEFLDRFAVTPLNGRVGLLNYEVSAAQIARWADEAGIPHDRLHLVNLRGRRNPLRNADDRATLAETLRERDVETLIVDPFGRAFGGRNQNDAAEVGAFLVDLDEFARAEVGAVDLILTAHAGWEGERTRGSSALEDWPDVIVTMTRDEDGQRFLKAEGRDVDVSEQQLDYSHDGGRSLVLVEGSGDRKAAAVEKKLAQMVGGVVEVVGAMPGLKRGEVAQALRGAGYHFDANLTKRAIDRAENAHLIHIKPGVGNAQMLHPGAF